MTSKNSLLDFEKSLLQLEEIVNKMEQGQLSLDQSLDAFEEGVQLTRQCQHMLKTAEQRVSKLVKSEDGIELSPFEQDENN